MDNLIVAIAIIVGLAWLVSKEAERAPTIDDDEAEATNPARAQGCKILTRLKHRRTPTHVPFKLNNRHQYPKK